MRNLQLVLAFALALCVPAATARSQQATPSPAAPEPSPPALTQREIFEALGLEIAKIRLEGIPPGAQVSLELTEWGPEPKLRTRRLAQLVARPDTDWMECLISARMEREGCRRINVELRHESAIYWRWPVDMERRFGAGVRALPVGTREGFLNFGSQVASYDLGTSRQIAEFRVTGRPRRHYIITLNSYVR